MQCLIIHSFIHFHPFSLCHLLGIFFFFSLFRILNDHVSFEFGIELPAAAPPSSPPPVAPYGFPAGVPSLAAYFRKMTLFSPAFPHMSGVLRK
jgi:hypothetical protein